jgi:hypothetical protein
MIESFFIIAFIILNFCLQTSVEIKMIFICFRDNHATDRDILGKHQFLAPPGSVRQRTGIVSKSQLLP